MGLGKVAGALLPGYAADLLILDRKAPHLAPSHDPASTLAYQARRGDVRQVLVNGRQVVKDGRLLTVDLPEVMARVREMARKVAKG
jgi:5-methylthioadenosine/S-adenosylhomocysteine deaminase